MGDEMTTREQVVQWVKDATLVHAFTGQFVVTREDLTNFANIARADLEATIEELTRKYQELAGDNYVLQDIIVEQAPFVEVGKAMVELTTTVRGVDEWPAIPMLWRDCVDERDEARRKVAEQAAEIESLRKDAERYRWLREADQGTVLKLSYYAFDALDKVIDAAIAAASKQEK